MGSDNILRALEEDLNNHRNLRKKVTFGERVPLILMTTFFFS